MCRKCFNTRHDRVVTVSLPGVEQEDVQQEDRDAPEAGPEDRLPAHPGGHGLRQLQHREGGDQPLRGCAGSSVRQGRGGVATLVGRDVMCNV